MAVMYTSYSLRTGEAIKESVVRESTEPAVDERVEDGESMAMVNQWQCRMNSIRSSAMSDVFIVLFISQSHF